MNDNSNRNKGKTGEDIAAAYLRREGYEIMERNYHCRYGEIDLVAKEGKTIVFVEVKSRRTAAFGAPEEAVGSAKQKKISAVALCYLTEKRLHDRPARFDVVTVITGNASPVIEIIRDAFDLI